MHICNMMQHDGEVLAKAVKESGMTVQHFAKMMGVSRNTPARWFETSILPADRLVKAANVLKVDPFTIIDRRRDQAFLEGVAQGLLIEQSENAQDTQQLSRADALRKCTIEREEWKTKAYEALDKYSKLLEAHNQILMGQREIK